jgi:hypothetical protein
VAPDWANVQLCGECLLCSFKKNYNKSIPNIWPLFFYGKTYGLILAKIALGYFWGELFSNLSSHPA